MRAQIEYLTGASDRPTGHGWTTVPLGYLASDVPGMDAARRCEWARAAVAQDARLDASDVRILAVHIGQDDGLANENRYTRYR